MPRYIDADALKFALCDDCFAYENGVCTMDDCVDGRCYEYNLIRRQPTADVAPVQHGKLIETGSDEYYGFWGDCTFCGRDNRIDARYCDNCGAKMDGGAG